eukprot:TRINITY_DN12216_c0_g1_i7.p1 TRINITY_DN12216_c0_g1~~TRINITY_DN12216_c0_g1_i7.p1  ORF type:complete len:1796 (-),score=493.68 TRINITY_DN12216_c0_g1_i7:100-5487(-)
MAQAWMGGWATPAAGTVAPAGQPAMGLAPAPASATHCMPPGSSAMRVLSPQPGAMSAGTLAPLAAVGSPPAGFGATPSFSSSSVGYGGRSGPGPCGNLSVCSCGNPFAADSSFCRRCGQPRPMPQAGVQGPLTAPAGLSIVPPTPSQFRAPSAGGSAPTPVPVAAVSPRALSPQPDLRRHSCAAGQAPATCGGAGRWNSPGRLHFNAPPRQHSPNRYAAPGTGVAMLRQAQGVEPIAALRQLSPQPQRHGGGPALMPPATALDIPIGLTPSLALRHSQGISPSPNAASGPGSNSLLARIDGVVSEMERSLVDDLHQVVRSPSLERRFKDEGAMVQNNAYCGSARSDSWLDKQIGSIEKRREACEIRQKHLADLRRMVDCGVSTKIVPSIESTGLTADTTANCFETVSSTAGGLTDVDSFTSGDALKKKVEQLAQQLSTSSLERQDVLRASEGLEAVVAALERNQAETKALREELVDAQALAEKDRASAAEAAAAQASAEADLRALEESSIAVLNDCRALQGRLRELESERTLPKDLQVAFDEERRTLNQRIQLLEDQRGELEVARQVLVDENHSLGKQHNLDIHGREEQASKEIAAGLLRERLLREELADKEAALAVASQTRRALSTAEQSVRNADRVRIADLERELTDARTSNGVLEASLAKFGGDRARIVQLEQELQSAQDAQQRYLQQHRTRVAELEQVVADAQTTGDNHQRQHASLKTALADMKQQFEDANARNETLVKQNATHKQKLVDMEELLADARSLGDGHARQLKTARERVLDLEKELSQTLQTQDVSSKEHSEHRKRVFELETELQEALSKNRKLAEASTARHSSSEMERLAEEHRLRLQALENEHAQKHDTARRDLQDLERQLRDALHAKEHHEKGHSALLERLTAMEAELDSNKEGTDRIEELERLLQDAGGREASHSQRAEELARALEDLHREKEHALKEKSRKHEAQQKRLEELEDALADAQGVAGEHASFKVRMRELEDLLDQAQGKADEHPTLLRRIEELEELRNSAQSSAEEHARLRRDADIRLGDLLHQVEASKTDRDAFRQRHDDASQRLQDLEGLHKQLQIQLEEAKRSHGAEASELRQGWREELERVAKQLDEERLAHETSRQRHVESVERERLVHDQHRSSAEELQKEVGSLAEELQEARATMARMAGELEQARSAGEAVERDSEAVLREADELRQRDAEEWSEKLRQAEAAQEDLRAQVRDLEAKLETGVGHLGRRAAAPAVEAPHLGNGTSSSSQAGRVARAASDALHYNGHTKHEGHKFGHRYTIHAAHISEAPTIPLPRRLIKSDLLRGSDDAFVLRVRESVDVTETSLSAAREAHAAIIRAQVATVSRHGQADGRLHTLLDMYADKQDLELQRRSVLGQVDASLRDLQALREELDTQRQLPTGEREQLREAIDFEVYRCREEHTILSAESPLGDLPHSFVETLVEIFRNGAEHRRDWDGGVSPMHWAAQNGRRDIIDFLLTFTGAASMLHLRDKYGRTPLYYAEKAERHWLADYLREDIGGGEVATVESPKERRPADLGTLSDTYLKVLEQVETQGWHTVNWKGGHTMLHWASAKGNTPLCAYLVRLDADPLQIDDEGRTPVDCAMDAGHQDTARYLRLAAPHDDALGGSAASASDRGHQRVIPDNYLKVMSEIDRIGWNKMQWARGFTLLHWAAKHDYADLCARFMAQGADPGHKDDTGKDALEYARERGSRAAEAQLLRPAPTEVTPLAGYIAASQARAHAGSGGARRASESSLFEASTRRQSVTVVARPRHSVLDSAGGLLSAFE